MTSIGLNRAWVIGVLGTAAIGASGVLVACSSTSGSPGPGSDAGTDTKTLPDSGMKKDTGTTGDGGAPPDSSSPTDSGSSDAGTEGSTTTTCSTDAVDAGGKAYKGTLLLTHTTTEYAAIGEFQALTGKLAATCTGMTKGSCCYETEVATTPAYVSAGTLTISDGASTLATLMPPATPAPLLYEEESAVVPAFTWAPGDTLMVAGSGATVDAFSLSIVAPALLAGTTPSFAATIAISTSADYVVSWTPSSETCSEVEFGLSQTGTGMPHIDCVVDDSKGTLTVPKAFLKMLTTSTGMAVLQRLETKEILATNAAVGIVAGDVLTVDATYTP